jgi:hypothetical protein
MERELLHVPDDPGCGGAERDVRQQADQREAEEQESPPFPQPSPLGETSELRLAFGYSYCNEAAGS